MVLTLFVQASDTVPWVVAMMWLLTQLSSHKSAAPRRFDLHF